MPSSILKRTRTAYHAPSGPLSKLRKAVYKAKMIGVKKATPEQLAAAKERARLNRITLFGPFSGVTPTPWVSEVLAKRRFTIISGGRAGPVKEIIESGIIPGKKVGVKNIAIGVPGMPELLENKNTKGKTRNVIIQGNERRGTRPLSERLAALHGHKTKAYLVLYPGEKEFSGTMMEMQGILNALGIEPMMKGQKQWPRPLILIGEQWKSADVQKQLKSTYERMQEGYKSRWEAIKDRILVASTQKELEEILDRK